LVKIIWSSRGFGCYYLSLCHKLSPIIKNAVLFISASANSSLISLQIREKNVVTNANSERTSMRRTETASHDREDDGDDDSGQSKHAKANEPYGIEYCGHGALIGRTG